MEVRLCGSPETGMLPSEAKHSRDTKFGTSTVTVSVTETGSFKRPDGNGF